jgi:hypothetical protein
VDEAKAILAGRSEGGERDPDVDPEGSVLDRGGSVSFAGGERDEGFVIGHSRGL